MWHSPTEPPHRSCELFDITMLLWEKPISPLLSSPLFFSFLFSFFLSGSRIVLTISSLLFYLLRGIPTIWYCICTIGDLISYMVLSTIFVLTAFYIDIIQPPFLCFCFDFYFEILRHGLTIMARLAWNFQSFYFSLLSAGDASRHCYAWLLPT